MKILIVISCFYLGGFTKSLINFLLCAEKYPELDITVLSLEKNKTNDYRDIPKRFHYIAYDGLEYVPAPRKGLNKDYLLNRQRIRNLEYVFVDFLSKLQKKPFPHKTAVKFMSFSQAEKAKRVTTDFSFASDFDVAISWEEIFCNYLLAEKIPCKHKIGYIHPNYKETCFSPQADRPYIKKFDRIVTISESCCSTLTEVFPDLKEKIVCLPNRMNLAHLYSLADEYVPDMDNKVFKIVTAARIVDSDKAVFRIVNLAGRLAEEGLDFKWYLIGDGADLDEVKRRITECGLTERVICVGQLDNPCPYMKNADLYVMQSYREGKPVAVDEAMALGTPALITDYSSAAEQVQENVNGWIVHNDEQMIFDKLREIITHPDMLDKAKSNLRDTDNLHYENCQPMIDMLKKVLQ